MACLGRPRRALVSRQWMRVGVGVVVSMACVDVVLVGAWLTSPSLHGRRSFAKGHGTRRSGSSIHSTRPVTLLHSLIDSEEIDAQQPSHASPKQLQTYWKLPRLYVGPRHGMTNNLSLASGAIIPLSPDQAHYLTNVMRILKKRKGRRKEDVCDGDGIDTKECIRIFNGRDGEWLAKVSVSSEQRDEPPADNAKKRKRPKQSKEISLVAECILQLRTQDSSDDDRPWVLFAPLKKQQRAKHMIEKCTELGAGRLIPVASDRTEGGALMALIGSKASDAQMDAVYGGNSREDEGGFDKLEAQAIEAAEQCERLCVPTITKELPWNRREDAADSLWKVCDVINLWCNDWDGDRGATDGRILLICRERGSEGDTEVVPILHALHDNRKAAFLIGPEGGWSAEEEEVFDELCSRYSESSNAPVRGVSLGSSVLRAETACMMAVGAWSLE